jgi:hypothetical protein
MADARVFDKAGPGAGFIRGAVEVALTSALGTGGRESTLLRIMLHIY